MSLTRTTAYLACTAGVAVVVDAAGAELLHGTLPSVVERAAQWAADIYCADSDTLATVVDAYIDGSQLGELDVVLRGSGSSGAPVPLSIRRTDWGARYADLRAQLPDGDLSTAAVQLGCAVDLAALDSAAAARWLARLHSAYLALCAADGVDLGVTLASTAAKLGIPRQWRTAWRACADRYEWSTVRQAYYGGRVACLQPGWRGDAVEYDLRSAYGWALTQPIPDWKIYDRRPLPRQPAWYDATVELSGPLGPLPVRHPMNPALLTYPSAGATVRGWWTRLDLDRSGVRVVELHRQLSGRWSLDLAPTVERWLERRAATSEPILRALYRSLPNCLAGKLCQKSTGWILWPSSADVPPQGAVPLGFDARAWAVPVVARHQPVTCPQAGSYVTALVRARLWPELQRSDAIYSDTDSIHLPADAPPPAGCGDAAGQWRRAASGHAHYRGAKNYTIGAKRVNARFGDSFAASAATTAATAA